MIGVRLERDLQSTVALHVSGVGRVTDPAKLPHLLDEIRQQPIVTDDVRPLVQLFVQAGITPVHRPQSLPTLQCLLCVPVAVPDDPQAMVDLYQSLWNGAGIATQALQSMETAVENLLARQTYASTHPAHLGTPFTFWRTLYPVAGASPNFRIMALDPPLTMMRPADRARYFEAPHGDLWVEAHWPRLQWHLLAHGAGDESLRAVLRLDEDLASTLLGVPEAVAVEVLASLLRCNGKDPAYVYHACRTSSEWTHGDAARVCAAYRETFSRAAGWLDEQAEMAMGTGAMGPYGYRYTTRKRETPEETYRSAVTGVLQTTEAYMLRVLMSLWEVQQGFRGGREFLGTESLIPIHDRLIYRLDRDVPVEAHVDVLRGLMPTFPVQVSMGPSAGEFYRVDVPMGDVNLSLHLRDEHVYCPHCKAMAVTRRSLERHIKDAHVS